MVQGTDSDPRAERSRSTSRAARTFARPRARLAVLAARSRVGMAGGAGAASGGARWQGLEAGGLWGCVAGMFFMQLCHAHMQVWHAPKPKKATPCSDRLSRIEFTSCVFFKTAS